MPRQVLVEIDAGFGRVGHVVVVISVRLLPGGQQLERRNGYVAGVKMCHAESVIEIVLRAADADALVEGAKRSGLVRSRPARGPFAFLGDDRNDAADGVRPEK